MLVGIRQSWVSPTILQWIAGLAVGGPSPIFIAKEERRESCLLERLVVHSEKDMQ